MRVGNFSVLIPQGCERDSGHVEIVHGTVFQINIGNHDYRHRCDAEVTVDGKSVGNFRIDSGGSLRLERPSHDTGCFTFFKADSTEANAAGQVGVAVDNRGLIQVIFRPERERVNQPVKMSGSIRPMSMFGATRSGAGGQSMGSWDDTTTPTSAEPENVKSRSLSSGITGLTGASGQQFTRVANLDYDPNGEVTITLRLVCGQVVRELTPVQRSNPIPSAVE